nr:TonB-dependent receptor [Luteimonas sp. BDR2-5]
MLAALVTLGAGGAVHAQQRSEPAPQQYTITAGSLGEALNQLATQSKLQIVYSPELVRGKSAQAVDGRFTWQEALQRLLADSGLEWGFVNETTVVIRQGTGSATGQSQSQAVTRNSPASTQSQEEVQELERLTVTGTRIRGGVTASPTLVIDELRFQQEGFTDLGEVIRSIPQNYRGGQNPGVRSGPDGAETNTNITGGSALNLRGLGPDATLTLLNGRRMSYDGYSQAVDISAIPIEAVERVEIVPDGASAIYGSDAVGGVANVVLKRDFEGVTLGTLYGDSSEGGLTQRSYTVTAGASWDSGGLIATYKKSDQDPIFADQRDYTQAMDDPVTLYPGSKVSSGLISAHQSLGQSVELRLDAMRTVRQQTNYLASGSLYLLDPVEGTITSVAPSIQVLLPGDWMLTAGATRGKNESIYDSVIVQNGVTTPSSNGSYFNKTQSWEVGVEGSLAQFGQHDLRLAIGVGGRTDEFEQRTFTSGVRRGGDERNRFAYGELSLPVVSAVNARPGVQRLELSAALRSEEYDSFGSVTTPKLGVIYAPSTDFTVKTSWGRSFKAPTLRQRTNQRYVNLYRAPQLGGVGYPANATVLLAAGGNPDLEPERARTWTASLAFHPEAIPGFDAELTFFSIDYTDRVLGPIRVIAQAMSDPAYAEFIQLNPSLEQQQQVIADFSDRFSNLSGAPYDPSNVVAIAYAHLINVARQRAKGMDLSGSYRFDLGSGQLMLRGGASWLDLSQQNTSAGPELDLSGRIYFPAELNGRLGAVWSSGGLSVSAFANHASGVTSRLTENTQKLGSFTTIDSTLRYETAQGSSALSGLSFSLSVDNVFNRNPPLYVPTIATIHTPYDTTNYSPIGRYVTVSVSKHW